MILKFTNHLNKLVRKYQTTNKQVK